MNDKFLESIEYLRDELAGTEHVCYLLYSIIKMSKPKNVIEFGVGYTTPFIIQAIRENMKNFNEITNKLKIGCYDGYMRNLNFSYYQSVPQYSYTGVDNMSHENSNDAIEYIKKQNDITVNLHLDNYNTLSKDRKYDFIWIDCGNFYDYVYILDNFTDIFEDQALILLHNTAHTPLHNLPNMLEIIEPNKDNQNSVTMLRYNRNKEKL
jgi:predicted O-methyltransferase YrrM